MFVVGFWGFGVLTVGPGKYDLPEKQRISGPTTTWKKPSSLAKKFQIIKEQK
jgi:hypothetical protein